MGDKIVDNLSVAVLGLGEAGSAFAGDLVAAGVDVRGFDPVPRDVEGIRRAGNAQEAVTGANLVLSINSATAALGAARDVALEEGQLYADLNSGSPSLKAAVAAEVEASGAGFADVALMSGVPGNGLRTPSLVSGSGAEAYAELLGALGAPVEVVGPEAGLAAERKLLRSVFMKGLAAAAIESLAAAEAAGCEEWFHAELGGIFEGASPALLERLLTGSRIHAARRVHEMEAACAMLTDLRVEPRIASAALGWLEQLETESHAG
jgi:3-hydroxyisobutyrate dehydrogenase-like beta-hydroxyacid dehydrogenase